MIQVDETDPRRRFYLRLKMMAGVKEGERITPFLFWVKARLWPEEMAEYVALRMTQ